MKKTILTGLALLVLNSSAFAFPIYMPDYRKGNSSDNIAYWVVNTTSKYGLIQCAKSGIIQTWCRNNKQVYRVGFNECKRELSNIPFYIHQIQKDILYLDNRPTDTVIDKIIPNPEFHTVSKYAPKCIEE